MWAVGRNNQREHHEHVRRSNLESVNKLSGGAGDAYLFIYSDAADGDVTVIGSTAVAH